MKRQGSRGDLTSCQNGTKFRTDQLIASEVGESPRNIQRYIRLTELIPDLLELVDKKKLPFTIAVEISYIDKKIQQWLYEYIRDKAYIYFSVEDIMELLNCGKNKAVKIMQELDDETGIGLIEKRRQGFGKVNIIYVKTFMPEKTEEKSLEDELKKFKKQTSV